MSSHGNGITRRTRIVGGTRRAMAMCHGGDGLPPGVMGSACFDDNRKSVDGAGARLKGKADKFYPIHRDITAVVDQTTRRKVADHGIKGH